MASIQNNPQAQAMVLQAQTSYAMQRDLSRAVARVISTGAKNHHLKELNRMFNVKRLAGKRAATHRQVAGAMAAAVQSKVSGIKGERYPEVRRSRLSGGLARAVNSPSFATGDAEGIKFIDRDLMNREARHWQRLNFGTGSEQEAAMIAKPRLGGRQLLDVTVKPIAKGGGSTLADPRMPVGMFYHGEGDYRPRTSGYSRTGRPFLVTKGYDFKKTAPIQPKHFINAGLQAFESGLGPAYRDLVDQYGKGSGGAKTTVPTKA